MFHAQFVTNVLQQVSTPVICIPPTKKMEKQKRFNKLSLSRKQRVKLRGPSMLEQETIVNNLTRDTTIPIVEGINEHNYSVGDKLVPPVMRGKLTH